MADQIDYGDIQQPPQPQQPWKAPRHVYFGPKDPVSGQMIDEPVYVRDRANAGQNYPCMRFKLVEGKIKAQMCGTAEQEAALGPGWYDSPSVFGAITEPTFEQSRLPPPKLTQPK